VGKVLVALIVLIAAAVAYEWMRTSSAPAIPVADTTTQSADASAANTPPVGRTDGSAAAPPAATRAAIAAAGAKGPIDLQINSEADLLAAMNSLGISDLDDRMTRWAISRGYPEFDQSGNYLRDQPYQQYDEATLRGLAEADDMWAQQILAQNIASDRPEEALEWYRKAAANGSVYAMQQMAQLYHRMSTQLRGEAVTAKSGQAGDDAPASTSTPASPEVTAYAWLVAAERSGWDATRGASLIPLIGRKLSPEQVGEACTMADSFREQMGSERSSRGLQPFARNPPPIVYSAEEMGASTQCHADESKTFDLSGCREAEVHTGNMSTRVWVCSQG
jgi:hypothetical protein